MRWEGKRACVTGGCGMIGSVLVERLSKLGADVLVIDNLSRGKLENIQFDGQLLPNVTFVNADLSTQGVAQKYIRDQEIVFALAAIVGGILELKSKPAYIGYFNGLVDQYTLRAVAENEIPHIMFASSACVYGVDKPAPYKEEDAGGQYDSIYGRTKHYSEFLAQAYAEEYGIKTTILRFFNVFSDREEFSLKSHVIPALAYKALHKMDPFVVWGSGEQTRSFVYTDDVIDGILLAVERVHKPDPINLGTPERVKIKDLALKILEISGHTPKKIVFDRNMPEGAHDRCASNLKAKRLLGWEPKFSFEEGLGRTVEHYKRLVQKGF